MSCSNFRLIFEGTCNIIFLVSMSISCCYEILIVWINYLDKIILDKSDGYIILVKMNLIRNMCNFFKVCFKFEFMEGGGAPWKEEELLSNKWEQVVVRRQA